MSDKIQVNLFIPPQIVEHLDTITEEWGVKRSAAMEKMIEREYKKLVRRRLAQFPTLAEAETQPVAYAEKGE